MHLAFHLNPLKNLSVRTKAIAAVVMPSAALVLALVLCDRTEQQLTTARNAVLRTAEVEMQAKTSIADIARAAAAIRGYALVPRPRFLEIYASEKQSAEDSLSRLWVGARLQREAARSLALEAQDIFHVLDKARKFAEAGDKAALSEAVLESGSEMDSIASRVDYFLAVESGLMNARREALEGAVRKHRFLLWISAFTGIGGGALASLILIVGVVSRLRRLQTKAQQLAEGMPLGDRIDGSDEFSRLDAILHLADEKIADRSRSVEQSRDEVRRANESLQSKATELARTVEELEEARERADSATRAKSDFLASMSHEIRSPMNAILGMAELLQDTRLTEEQAQYVDVFRRAGGNLLTIINDILDLSKIESGRIDLQEVPFDLDEVLTATSAMMAPRAHQKGLELIVDCDSAVERNVTGDPDRLTQVLVNLLSNAIKFTERGLVSLRVERRAATDEQENLHISVSDTGIGIPDQKLGMIFERFAQADASISRSYGGTGLGLAISRRIVEMMEGRIWAESTPGKGSVFHLTVPFRASGKSTEPLKTKMDLRGRQILVVDDLAENRLILRKMLDPMGAVLHEAESGEVALPLALGRAYDLILVDSRMPGMGGFDFAERLKLASSGRPPAIVMLTSDNRSEDVERSRALGFAAYLIKPVERKSLFQAIQAALTGRGVRRSEAAGNRQGSSGRARRILLAEDSQDNVFLVKAYLKGTGYQLDIACNGRIAVERFKENPPDIVLMDVQMPVLDGYSATRAIREWEAHNQRRPAPIIALTAHALKEEPSRAADAGCTMHLTKPISKTHLLEALEHVYAPPADQIPTTEEPVVLPELAEFVPGFIRRTWADLSELEGSLAEGKLDRIRFKAHDLKGTGGALGFPGLTALGAALEDAARKGDVPFVAEQLKKLRAYLSQQCPLPSGVAIGPEVA